jgi:lipopolysaccharide transport system permease protein
MSNTDIEYEIKPVGKFSFNLKELWEYRELFYFFTWRDIKVKYKQTFLGFAWAILQPLAMMLIFTFFFGRILKVPSDSMPYPVFVYSGLMLWNLFSSGLSNSGNSMVDNSNIIKKIYFPRLIIPLSSILVASFDFLMTFIIYVCLLIIYSDVLDFSIIKFVIFLPISIFITLLTTFGIGSFLSALNVKYRDFRYILPFFIQLLFFITPVIYPSSIIPDGRFNFLLSLNPMVGAIMIFRNAIANTPLDFTVLIISILSALTMFIAGLYYFRKTEYYFADLA